MDKQFVTIIKDLSFDESEGLIRIGVSLIDTTHPRQDVYIEKELVDSGRAVFLCV